MNISLPEALKQYVHERARSGNFSNPSDYIRSLIRQDQQRQAAEALVEAMADGYFKTHPKGSPDQLDELRGEFWRRWLDLRTEIDKGIASLDKGESVELDETFVTDMKKRGRARLAAIRKAS